MNERRCLHHPACPVARRGMCWACYRKFAAAGLALPPRVPSGPAPLAPEVFLLLWVASLSPEHRARLHEATAPRARASSPPPATTESPAP